MRLVARHGCRYAVNHPSGRVHYAALQKYARAINTRPHHERPPPITERFDLRRQPNPQAKSIGVLGGGITGLATAWHLSSLVPDAKITVYEKAERFGGWMASETVTTDEGDVVFEWGPRNLRPDTTGSGRATVTLLRELDLQSQIIGVRKTAPAALNRFIYYDGRLVKMPGPNPALPTFINAMVNGYKVLTEPIFKGVLGSAFAEHWVKPRPANMTDESVGDFVRRRFGKTAANNLVSAFFHGIYAGDLYKLSARTLLPFLWHMELRDPEGAGVLMEMADVAFKGHGLMQTKYGRYMDLLEAAATNDGSPSSYSGAMLMQDLGQDVSVYTLNFGLETLSSTLIEKLGENSNVNLKQDLDVQALEFDPEKKQISVITEGNHRVEQHDYIVSTLSAKKLGDFVQSSTSSRGVTLNSDTDQALKDTNKSVNVGVVNLYYLNPDLIPSSHSGFGYLIPRSVDVDQNPERALGVIFGSDSSGPRGKDAVRTIANPGKYLIEGFEQAYNDLVNDKNADKHKEEIEDRRRELDKMKADLEKETDEVTIRMGQDTAPGTKLTVMLGGHWWEDWTEADLPNEQELIDMAQTVLARHLKIMQAPLVAKARIARDCIPQYTVGYRQRMASVHRGLMEEFQGRLKVAGSWWQGGVGVNDCIMNAHMTAFNIREGWDDETGLKEYTEKEKWLVLDRRTQTFTPDPAN